MFSLFTGKISGVLSLAFQGISKALGFIVDTASQVIDTVVETVDTLVSPVTDTLSQLPLLGSSLEGVLELKSNLLGNLSNGLDAVAEEFNRGDLLGGVNTALNGVTSTLGQTLTDTSQVIEDAVALTSPITGLIANVPGLDGILNAASQTTSNLLGFVEETGAYVANINPTDLIAELLTDPTATIGGVVQDGSVTLENLLNDLAPVTNTIDALPLLGQIVDVTGQVSSTVTQGVYDLGTQITQIDLLDPLNTNQPYI